MIDTDDLSLSTDTKLGIFEMDHSKIGNNAECGTNNETQFHYRLKTLRNITDHNNIDDQKHPENVVKTSHQHISILFQYFRHQVNNMQINVHIIAFGFEMPPHFLHKRRKLSEIPRGPSLWQRVRVYLCGYILLLQSRLTTPAPGPTDKHTATEGRHAERAAW